MLDDSTGELAVVGSARPAWVVSPEELAAGLGADPHAGLSTAEGANRLAAEGRNELQSKHGPGALALLGAQFKSVVIWVLIGAGVLSASLGEWMDSIAIGAIVVLNALIGFYQEFRAERAVAALRRMTAPHARVIRGGQPLVVPLAEVVRGDLLLLKAGDLVAADARLVSAHSLRTDEGPLTGESEPVEKDAADLTDPDTPLAERLNMVYFGTSAVAGQARALVTATGMQTEVGHIARLLQTAGDGQTPLQRRLDRVGRKLLFASLTIVLLVFALGLVRGEEPGRMLLTAVSLAVAAIPEGLPAVVTVALALGVARMVRRHALVRRLPAVETLGCAQVICTDKTGTLTVGQMTVRVVWVGGREISVTGEGYGLDGEWLEQGNWVDARADGGLEAVLIAGAACNEGELTTRDERPGITGDPTDGALLVAAAKGGVDYRRIEADEPRLRVVPFDNVRKRMTIVRGTKEGARAYVKGAPDVLLGRCTRWLTAEGGVAPLTDEVRADIAAANVALAGRALRVICVAERDLDPDHAAGLAEDLLESELTFNGLLALQDPPRPEAREAVARCRSAGIRVVMITGDHPATAAAIATDLGILREGERVATGLEVQGMTEDRLGAEVNTIAAYARVTAEDKLRVVRALRTQGLVVAMTGDGVNDAPAVKEASIGVAMGITGTEVTKEAADMVVTDDNFASIVAAVEEGRGIYDNIKKCLQYLLAGNTAEILVMLVAALVGWPIPLLPLQLLWINLVTDGLPALALASDPADSDVLNRPPRAQDEELTDRSFLGIMLFTGALDAGIALAAFFYGLAVHRDVVLARTFAFTALVYSELIRSFGARTLDRPLWVRPVRANRWLAAVVVASLLLQLLILHLQPLRTLFGICSITLTQCLVLLALGCIPLLVLELRKAVRYRRPVAAA